MIQHRPPALTQPPPAYGIQLNWTHNSAFPPSRAERNRAEPSDAPSPSSSRSMDKETPRPQNCSTTINSFLHEAQLEALSLRQQLLHREGLIAELKARLSRFERTTCVLDGEEPCVVGPSQSLVESLLRENCKLQQKLKLTEEDMGQKLETSKREIQLLQQKLKEKQQELQWPEHEKELEIQRLRAILASRDRAQATRDVLCDSLVEESEQLRRQLGATVRVCEDLMGRLDKQKNSTEHGPMVSEGTDCGEVMRLNAVMNKVQEENQQLKKRVAYVENLNSRWQKYDLSREEYVRALCQKLKESSGLGTVAGSPALFQQEIGRLNGLLEEKMQECRRLSQERDECTKKNNERIQILEQQVLAYIEDFESERKDRERAHGKILHLQEEVERLKLQIHEQNGRDAASTRRRQPNLKKASRKPAESVQPLRNSPPDLGTRQSAPEMAESELQCPTCLTIFDDNNTTEYWNHTQECARY